MNIRPFLRAGVASAILLAGNAHAGFIANFHENLVTGNNALFIFGSEGTTGTINANDGFSENFTIGAGGVFERNFGTGGREMGVNGAINNLSLRVDSADPISGLALNRGSASSDMTTLLDDGALSTDYRVLTTPGVFGDGSQMSVTAVEDGTTVTIESPIALAGNPANTPFSVTLNAGESVFYESGRGGDLSGTRVTSNNNVAVFGGAECTQVPVGTVACDQVISQQFGVENFDTEFDIVSNFGGGSDGDLIRVIASVDNTEVFLNGVSVGVINENEVLEIDNVGDAKLTSSDPVMVGQFVRGQGGTRTTGDPAFAIIPSVNQVLSDYVFAAPTGTDSFIQNFLNIAIDQALAATLTLNGSLVDTSAFSLINGTLFGNVAIGTGIGNISAGGNFLATIAGFSSFDSYFSPVATSFSPGVSPDPDPEPDPEPTPVPEPGTMLLLGGGLLAIGLGSRRRRHASSRCNG